MATKKKISRFFADLGFPLWNIRWSWGSLQGNALLLRTWQDEMKFQERRMLVLKSTAAGHYSDSYGLDERIRHLEALWTGELGGYAVVAEAKDTDAKPRVIGDFRPDGVYALERLEQQADGSIAGFFNAFVKIEDLPAHRATHRTKPGVGPFPIDESQRSGVSTASFQAKVPAIRALLINVCRTRGTVTYSELMASFALTFYPLVTAMGQIGHACQEAGEPIITALIVDKETQRCSDGLFDEFGVEDDALERERCYAYWAQGTRLTSTTDPAMPTSKAGAAPTPQQPDDEFEQRVSRFAEVEVRTHQRTFRVAVFRACGGRCVISGCDVPEALEAAHLLGREWKQGHNSAADGILLRRDLHTLYDRGLLEIGEDGVVHLAAPLYDHYKSLKSTSVSWPTE